jgi:hypothetical protein
VQVSVSTFRSSELTFPQIALVNFACGVGIIPSISPS